MTRGDLIIARLIVWEGTLPVDTFRKKIQEYTNALRFVIDKALENTQWRYQIWRLRTGATTDQQRLEIHIKHPIVTDAEKYAAMNTLCEMLLISDVPENLRGIYPEMAFTFCPSREGRVDSNDEVFAQYFCKTIVEKLCLGKDELAKKMEATKDSFLSRNSTKFYHQPMVGIYTAADISERYANIIQALLFGVDMYNNGDHVRDNMKKAVKAKMATAIGSKIAMASQGAACDGLSKLIAVGCAMIRAFVAYSPKIKKELQPLVERLNNVITAARLAVAKDAYLEYSEKPIKALQHLRTLENPSNEDLAMTVNTFGILMQSTLPLFNELYVVTDSEFATIATLSGIAGAGVVGLAGGGAWWAMAAAGAAGGPIGVMAAGGVIAVSFGVAAICEGVKWGNKQNTNPSAVLIRIQKSLQECSLFILGLISMAAERDENSVYKDMLKDLKDQLQNENYGKAGYAKGYYKNVSKKLERDMKDLKKGLAEYTVSTEDLKKGLEAMKSSADSS